MRVEMRIEMLNLGWMTAAVGIWRQGEPEPESPVRLPVPAYLIETESERILVDTGLHPAAVADSEAHYGPGPIAFFGLEQEASIAEQVDLSTLTKVVLTHLHFDHAGGLELIPDSVPVVVQRAEWEGGHDRGAIERTFFLPRDYADAPANLVLVDGDHDLLGDGSVQLLSTPGHAPGASVGADRRPRDRRRRRPLGRHLRRRAPTVLRRRPRGSRRARWRGCGSCATAGRRCARGTTRTCCAPGP